MRSVKPRVPAIALCLSLLPGLLAACASDGPGDGAIPRPDAPTLDRDLGDGAGGNGGKTASPSATSTSRVLAHVNGRAINYRDVLQRIGPETVSVVSPEERKALEDQALLDIVRDRLLEDAAIVAEIPVGRHEFEAERGKRVKEIDGAAR